MPASPPPRAPHLYSAYGLVVHSELALPGLLPLGRGDPAPADVVVRLEEGAVPGPGDAPTPRLEHTGNGETRLRWSRAGVLTVRAGRAVVVQRAPSTEVETLGAFVVAQALPVLLGQRGLLVLHGSAVKLARRAVVFVGARSTGKSTLAAAFVERGRRVIADDVSAVVVDGEGASVAAGPPALKLWPDTLAHFGSDPERLDRVYPTVEKRLRPVGPGGSEPIPLDRVYLLRLGERLAITPLRGRDALLGLLPHVWGLPRTPAARKQLALSTRLAEGHQIWALERPPGLGLLPKLARLLEEAAREVLPV